MSAIVWHDLECGSYTGDLDVWRALADRCSGPVLDIGAGTGRTALEIARRGHAVTALDSDAELLAELRRRVGALPVTTVLADARTFTLAGAFALCIVPMQTIQLLGGPAGRAGLYASVRAALADDGRAAIAVASELDAFDVTDGGLGPLPDVCEIDGVVYSSRPTAVRARPGGWELERMRERVTAGGELTVSEDRIALDALDAATVEAEARAAGFATGDRISIPADEDYVGSDVVVLSAV